MNSEVDWEPVEVDEGGCDELPGFGASANPGSGVPHDLEPAQGPTWNPTEGMY